MIRFTLAILLCGVVLSIPALSQKDPTPEQQSASQSRKKGTKGAKVAKSAKGAKSSESAKNVPLAQQFAPTSQQSAPPVQAPAGQPQITFRTTPTEVILPVTVTNEKGKFIDDLSKDDFRIQDEGRTQKITFFYHDSRAIRQHTVIGFLVDMSSNTTIHWDKFKDATKELVWGLLPNDPDYTGYLISYSTTAELAVNTTSDPDKLTDRVDRLKPGGGAALYNAIHMACTDRKLVPGEPYQPRRIIIVVGDGHDTASEYTLDQVIELAQRNYVTIYGVSTLAFGSSSPDSGNLERLAKETGGHVEYPLLDPYGKEVSGYLSTPSDEGNYALKVGTGGYTAMLAGAVNKAVQNLQGEITTQYILRYVPDIEPGTEYKDKRRIKVDVMSLPAGSVNIQTRPYYFANPVR